MFWLPPDVQPLCKHCGNTCEQWRCEICREIHCGYDSTGPIDINTLNDGRKCVCTDCADVNIDDCAVRDLRQAREILHDLWENAEPFIGIEDLDEHETPVSLLGHAIEYLDRRTAEERGIGYSEFVSEMLTDSISKLRKPETPRDPNAPLTLPDDTIQCEVCREAHNYPAIYTERFGSAPGGEVARG